MYFFKNLICLHKNDQYDLLVRYNSPPCHLISSFAPVLITTATSCYSSKNGNIGCNRLHSRPIQQFLRGKVFCSGASSTTAALYNFLCNKWAFMETSVNINSYTTTEFTSSAEESSEMWFKVAQQAIQPTLSSVTDIICLIRRQFLGVKQERKLWKEPF